MSHGPAESAPEASRAGRSISRRTIVRSAAWSIPVIVAATAAPAYASSTVCPGWNWWYGTSVETQYSNLNVINTNYKEWKPGSTGTVLLGFGRHDIPNGYPAFGFSSSEQLDLTLTAMSVQFTLPFGIAAWGTPPPGWTLTSTAHVPGSTQWTYTFTSSTPTTTAVTSNVGPGTVIVPLTTISGTIDPPTIPNGTNMMSVAMSQAPWSMNAGFKVLFTGVSSGCPGNGSAYTATPASTITMQSTVD